MNSNSPKEPPSSPLPRVVLQQDSKDDIDDTAVPKFILQQDSMEDTDDAATELKDPTTAYSRKHSFALRQSAASLSRRSSVGVRSHKSSTSSRGSRLSRHVKFMSFAGLARKKYELETMADLEKNATEEELRSDPEILNRKGNILKRAYLQDESQKDFIREALQCYAKAARDGNPNAQFNLAEIYFFGYHLEPDVAKAFEFYSKAASEGSEDAENMMGDFYLNIHEDNANVPYDPVKALEFYKRAAEKGHPEAMCNVGTSLRCGEGTEVDLAGSVQWYTRAAAAGHSGAMNYLGDAHAWGEGVDLDLKEGYHWYVKSAILGNPFGRLNQGLCLYEGRGVKRDLRKCERILYGLLKSKDVSEEEVVHDTLVLCGRVLGKMNELGTDGAPCDLARALDWYRYRVTRGLENESCEDLRKHVERLEEKEREEKEEKEKEEEERRMRKGSRVRSGRGKPHKKSGFCVLV